MYVGSMYLISGEMSASFSFISFWRNLAKFCKTGLPLASVSPILPRISCPAPSATSMTQCSFRVSTLRTCASTPPSPSRVVSISGIRQTSTSPDARAACMAMNPDCRPMTRTRPTPLNADRASMAADLIALIASSTAVWNPKVRSRRRMSLSIVLGMPMTAVGMFRSRHMLSMASAPACDPLPPMTNRKSSCISAMASTMSLVSLPPRDEPRMLPPSKWIVSTKSDVSLMGCLSSPSCSKKPLKPYRIPLMSFTPYSSSVITSCLMTSLSPGQRPPQVTMAALTLPGSK
mmetsp:Transcript_9142/g.36871  ORF Transcript_9142/g.36871 Transcript_9142/m.36871 type:complete len:289 (+) Transcript_9142:292-1158(+)